MQPLKQYPSTYNLTGENGKGSRLSTNSKRNDTFLEKLQAGQSIEEAFGGPNDSKSYTKTVPIQSLVSNYIGYL
jgi:hypothetical protein